MAPKAAEQRFPKLSRHRSQATRRVIRWLLVLAAALLLVLAAGDLLRVAEHNCPLPLSFEVSRTELVSRQPWPPRATCRYFYEDPDGVAFLPPSTHEFNAIWGIRFGAAAGVMLIIALALGKGRAEVPDTQARATKPRTETSG